MKETQLLSCIEDALQKKSVSLRRVQSAGYTTAEHWIVELADGTSAFIKAATDALTAKWLRDEVKVYAQLSEPFMPRFIRWADGENPLLFLEDLSLGEWQPKWTNEHTQRVLATIDRLAAVVPANLPSLTSLQEKLNGWREIKDNPTGFLGLGLVTTEWLQNHLETLIEAEEKIDLTGNSLVHVDIRSDNICFLKDRTIFVDWNHARQGNSRFDLIAWLPSLGAEGGPMPWDITLDEPEMIAAVAGFFAARAPRPPHIQGPRIRQLQLSQLKIALPWACKALDLPDPK